MDSLNQPSIRLKAVTLANGHTPILKEVSIDIQRGATVAIIGASGSGKTSLLRVTAGLVEPLQGTVQYLFSPTGDLPVTCAYVSQHLDLWPNLTALENVAFPLWSSKRLDRAAASEAAALMLKNLGIVDCGTRFPLTLSGGQCQRVAIARALITKPDILLLDEITSALDPKTALETLRVVRETKSSTQTIIIATHHLGFAATFTDHIIYLQHGMIIEQLESKTLFSADHSSALRQFVAAYY